MIFFALIKVLKMFFILSQTVLMSKEQNSEQQRFYYFTHVLCMFTYLQISQGPVKRICVFEHSVMTNFNCACPAIQRGQGSGFLSEGSS